MGWARPKHHSDGRTVYMAMYRDPSGRTRSAGTFTSQRQAINAARDAEREVETGEWFDQRAGRMTFAHYVERYWWPNLHVEVTTRAAYRSYLDKYFLPTFGGIPMLRIQPHLVQNWVADASTLGCRRGRSSSTTPCCTASSRWPCETASWLSTQRRPPGCRRSSEQHAGSSPLRSSTPSWHRSRSGGDRWCWTAIETGMRWGELVALRPRHIDWLRRAITVRETVIETSKKHSPTGERVFIKPYPKDDEPRTISVSPGLLEVLSARIAEYGLGRDDYLFPSVEGRSDYPVSRNTFRTRVWQPAVKAAGLERPVRMHDLRHAHASWLLAGGADLPATMERLGHRQLATTQQYVHTLPDADQRALAAFTRGASSRRPTDVTGPAHSLGTHAVTDSTPMADVLIGEVASGGHEHRARRHRHAAGTDSHSLVRNCAPHR